MANSANSRHCASRGLPCPPIGHRRIAANCGGRGHTCEFMLSVPTATLGIVKLTSKKRRRSSCFRTSILGYMGTVFGPIPHRIAQHLAPLQYSGEVAERRLENTQKSNEQKPRSRRHDVQRTVGFVISYHKKGQS